MAVSPCKKTGYAAASSQLQHTPYMSNKNHIRLAIPHRLVNAWKNIIALSKHFPRGAGMSV